MITTTEKEILNNSNPTNQSIQLGDELYNSNVYGLYCILKSIEADATGELAVTIPFACEILDVIVQARATVSDGTVTVKAGATAITDAIIMASDKVITRAGTIDDSVSTLAAGATVTVDTANSADRGVVTLVVRRV